MQVFLVISPVAERGRTKMTTPMSYDELAAAVRELREAGVNVPLPQTGFGMPALMQPAAAMATSAQAPSPSPMPRQPNGLPDLSNVPAFGEQGFAAGLDKFGPGLLAELAPFAMGPIGRALSYAPRAAAAAYGVLAPTPANPQTAQRSAAPSDDVKNLQRMLQSKGYYKGPIDGFTGGQTEEANKRFHADEQAKRQQEIEAARSAAELEAARARAAETKRLQEEGTRRAAEEAAGQERLKEVGEPSWLEQYGPLFGYVPGVAAAGLGRAGLSKFVTNRAQQAANRADELMTSAGSNVNRRVGNVNQFWTEGGKGPAPFTYEAGRRPHPWQPNPSAAPAEQLYRPSVTSRFAPDAAVIGTGVTEAAGSHFVGVEPARAELAAAQAGIDKQASEANIQRLMAARQSLALAQTFENFGRGMSIGGLGAGLHAYAKHEAPRPNVGVAEGERGQLDKLINPPPKKRRR